MADQDASEFEEAEVDVGSSFVADAEAFEGVQPGEAAFDDPAFGAQAAAVFGVAAGDFRNDLLIA